MKDKPTLLLAATDGDRLANLAEGGSELPLITVRVDTLDAIYNDPTRQVDCILLGESLGSARQLEFVGHLRDAGIVTPIIVDGFAVSAEMATAMLKRGANDLLFAHDLAPVALAERISAISANVNAVAAVRPRHIERDRFLAEATRMLSSSLDYEATLSGLANLAVPSLADLCVVDMLEDNGLRRPAVAHADPSLAYYAADLRRFPPDIYGPHPVAQALRSRNVQFAAKSTDELMVRIAQTDHHLALLRTLRFDSYIVAPLIARGRSLGAVSFIRTAENATYDETDVQLVQELAYHMALAVDNARLFEREHRVAETLQSAFLSNIPERLPGLSIARAYHAGMNEAQVGGDFYDVFTLPDGRVAMVVADISGKGLAAAVQTATVKYSLRAFAVEAAAPSLVITRLNRLLRTDTLGIGEHFVTLFYGVFDASTGRLAFASAGHETQIVKRRSGGIALLGATGPIMGVTDHRYEQSVEYVRAGDSIVLFTDGLTEARNHSRELLDINRVAAAIDRAPKNAGPAAIVARLERLATQWANSQPHDDMAILCVRHEGEGIDRAPADATGDLAAVAGPLRPGDGVELIFDFTFPSRPDYAAEVRQAVAHWMAVLEFDLVSVEDFQTAVTEAIMNAVRHGSPEGHRDQFRVRGYRSTGDTLIVEVGDRGPGIVSDGHSPAMPPPEAVGGRGLPLMQVLADDVAYVPSATEHWVRLIKRPR